MATVLRWAGDEEEPARVPSIVPQHRHRGRRTPGQPLKLPPEIESAIWRGTELGSSVTKVVSSGFPALDAELPGAGWPCHSLTEILQPQPTVTEWRLLAPAIRQVVASGLQVVIVGPPKSPHLPGLRFAGLDEKHLVWVQTETPSERLWVTEQLVKANSAGLLISWLPQARQEQIRRLQVCAASCDGPVFLCRPMSAEHEPSAAPLRVQVRFSLDWELRVHLMKRKGPTHEGDIALASVPGGLQSLITPRLMTPSDFLANRDLRERELDHHALGSTAPEKLPSDESRRTEATAGIATWCLQFTPRVALIEPLSLSPAVVMEVEASVRLFGGKRKLVERVKDECGDLGVRQLSWAPTSLAAVALARTGTSNGFARPLEQVLDALPMGCLTNVAAHHATLARLGCKTLGNVRALPRGGMSRRFDAELLGALDQAYGMKPEAHSWVELPEEFHMKMELMSRIDMAPALLFGARRLLVQMAGWLGARHSGVTAFTLKWCHDAMRSKTAGDGGELTVRTAEPTRDVEHLTRLLAEHLAKVELLAPVGDLEMLATDVQSLEDKGLSLFPEPQQAGESLALVLERIAARLGPDRVLRPVVTEDHRLEWMCHWQTAPAPRPKKLARQVDMPQPTFILPEPLRLAVKSERPMYQGSLIMLTGPHRVEGGWWDRTLVDGKPESRNVVRDYWVALSEHAGVLWVFQVRLGEDAGNWFLHGTFA